MSATLYEIFEHRLKGRYRYGLDHNNLDLLCGKDHIAVVYYDTAIVKAFPDGRIVLNNGGFLTKSTKQFMNDQLPGGWFIRGSVQSVKPHVMKGWWLVDQAGVEYQYENDMQLVPDGLVGYRIVYAWEEVQA